MTDESRETQADGAVDARQDDSAFASFCYIRTDTLLYWAGNAQGWVTDERRALHIAGEDMEEELQRALVHAGHCALYVGTVEG